MSVVVRERVKCLTKEQSRSLQKNICLCHLLANSTSVAKPINWYRNIRKLHKKSHCNTTILCVIIIIMSSLEEFIHTSVPILRGVRTGGGVQWISLQIHWTVHRPYLLEENFIESWTIFINHNLFLLKVEGLCKIKILISVGRRCLRDRDHAVGQLMELLRPGNVWWVVAQKTKLSIKMLLYYYLLNIRCS